MAKGRVYIVRNPLFPTLFKIGFTTKGSVEDRGLNASNVPEAFEVIREYECEDFEKTEALFHKTFDQFRYYSELDKRGKRTEFFTTACLANAVAWMDTLKGLSDITVAAEEEAEAKAKKEEASHKNLFDKSKVVRRSAFNFSLMGIPVGATLTFDRNVKIQVKVIDSKLIKYKGCVHSLSYITAHFLRSKAKYVHPTPYWSYNGKNLLAIYNKTYPKK